MHIVVRPWLPWYFPASTAPSGCYQTADGAIILASYQQGHWLKLIDCLDPPDLGEDERFATLAARIAHRTALVATLSEIIRTRSSQEWLTRLTAAGLVAGEVRTYDQVVTSEQFRAIGLELELDGPEGERSVRTLRSPWTFSSFEGAATALSPRLGEATEGFATPAR